MIFKEKSRQIGCTLYNLHKVGTLCYNNVIPLGFQRGKLSNATPLTSEHPYLGHLY
jgi:hypothetical protein